FRDDYKAIPFSLAFLNLLKSKENVLKKPIKKPNGECLAIFGASKSFSINKSYISAIENPKIPIVGINRNDVKVNLVNIIPTFFFLIVIWLLFLAARNRKRRNLAIFFKEYVEIVSLFCTFKRFKIKKLFFINGFEKDANFISFL